MSPVISGSYGENVAGIFTQLPVYFVMSDGGRRWSHRPKQKNDCTVRALAIVCGVSYDAAYEFLAEAGRKCSHGFRLRGVERAFGCDLVWRPFPAVKGASRMNPAKFCLQFPDGRWIVKTAKHVFAIVDGAVWDEWSPCPARCIYGAWQIVKFRGGAA